MIIQEAKRGLVVCYCSGPSILAHGRLADPSIFSSRERCFDVCPICDACSCILTSCHLNLEFRDPACYGANKCIRISPEYLKPTSAHTHTHYHMHVVGFDLHRLA